MAAELAQPIQETFSLSATLQTLQDTLTQSKTAPVTASITRRNAAMQAKACLTELLGMPNHLLAEPLAEGNNGAQRSDDRLEVRDLSIALDDYGNIRIKFLPMQAAAQNSITAALENADIKISNTDSTLSIDPLQDKFVEKMIMMGSALMGMPPEYIQLRMAEAIADNKKAGRC